METVSVVLSPSLKAFVESEVAAGKHRTASDFICLLVEEARKRKARERVETLLQEGLDSGPATPMTAEDLQELRKGLDRELIDALLLEGLNSGDPLVADDSYWEQKRQRMEQRLGKEDLP